VLERPSKAVDAGAVARLKVRPTRDGLAHAVTQLGASEQASAALWEKLPALTSINPLRALKPGAVTLLSGADERRREQVVLAYQRYGRGKAIAFPVQDSWLWQMHADITVEDQTHETLWRQLLRWLVRDAPDRLTLALGPDRVPAGEPVAIGVTASDSRFDAVNSDAITARITGPTGRITDLALPWSGIRDGFYQAPFVPQEPGRYDLEIAVQGSPDSSREAITGSFTVGDSEAELRGAAMQAPRLREMATRSGGRFYTPATVASLPQDIALSGSGITVTEQKDLWDMPVIFLVLVGLLGTEWGYRRWRGLA
jgi:hypothetical protein